MAKTAKNTEEVPARLARAIKDSRERRGWSQAKLAELVDVSVDHVSKIERQVYQPSLEMAARFIVALELDANALINAKPVGRNVSKKRLETEAAAVRALETLNDKSLDTAAEILAVLARR